MGNEECQYFTYSTWDLFCNLKSGRTNVISHKNAISGPKLCQDTDCFDYETDYNGSQLKRIRNIQNAKHCQNECQKNEECQYFTYSTWDLFCNLKSGRTNVISHKNAISGPKLC